MCINTKMHIYTYTYCNYKYVYKANIKKLILTYFLRLVSRQFSRCIVPFGVLLVMNVNIILFFKEFFKIKVPNLLLLLKYMPIVFPFFQFFKLIFLFYHYYKLFHWGKTDARSLKDCSQPGYLFRFSFY